MVWWVSRVTRVGRKCPCMLHCFESSLPHEGWNIHLALVRYISSTFNSKPINHFNQSTAEILREITGAQQSRRIKMSNSCLVHHAYTIALNVQLFMHEVHPANQDSGDCWAPTIILLFSPRSYLFLTKLFLTVCNNYWNIWNTRIILFSITHENVQNNLLGL